MLAITICFPGGRFDPFGSGFFSNAISGMSSGSLVSASTTAAKNASCNLTRPYVNDPCPSCLVTLTFHSANSQKDSANSCHVEKQADISDVALQVF